MSESPRMWQLAFVPSVYADRMQRILALARESCYTDLLNNHPEEGCVLNTDFDLTPDPGLSTTIEARKLTAYMPVSCCLLTDTTGVMHCTHPPAPRPSRRTRLRWGARRRWANLRLRAGTWVAGVDLPGRD